MCTMLACVSLLLWQALARFLRRKAAPSDQCFCKEAPPLEEGVLVAHDLLPSELVMIDRRMLLGLVLEAGFARSSTYVILEALGIPTLVQVAGILAGAVDGETIIIDADEGFVVVEPPMKTNSGITPPGY